MTAGDRERRRIASPIWLLSALAWGALLAGAMGVAGLSHCEAMAADSVTDVLRALLAANPVSSLATGWALMLIAMMSPTLIAPLAHVHRRSFKHRRLRSISLFVFGYGSVWIAAGAALSTLQLMAMAWAPHSLWPAVAAALVAGVWQCSPLKQLCLNRSHNHTELAAFGIAADRDALGFGLMHGVWCVGSCWALMLVPMLLVHGHMLAMVAVSIVMIGERLEHARPLGWRLRGPGKLMRIAMARTRMMVSPRQSAGA